MSIATTADAKLLIATQTQFGTPITAGSSFDEARFTGESLNFNAETALSEEITSSREVGDVVRISQSAGGDINFELSHDTAFDQLFQSLMHNTYSTDDLTNGTTPKFLTIHKELKTGATTQRFKFADMLADTFSLEVPTGGLVTGTFGLIGSGLSTDTSATTSANANDGRTIVNTVSSGAVTTGTANASAGGALSNVVSMGLEVTNNLREQRAIGSTNLVGVGSGRFEVTGSLEIFFAGTTEFNQFLQETAFSLQVVLKDPSNTHGYTFYMPNVKYTTSEIVAEGANSDIIANFEFQALAGTTETLKITKHD